METPDKILFVCTNQRLPEWGRESCGDHKAGEIAEAFRRALKMRGMAAMRLRATSSGCLGPCDRGPYAVVMPDNVWYAGFSVEDVDEIIDSHLLGGVPVARIQAAPVADGPQVEEV